MSIFFKIMSNLSSIVFLCLAEKGLQSNRWLASMKASKDAGIRQLPIGRQVKLMS